MVPMMGELAMDVTGGGIPNSNCRLAEEQPALIAQTLIDFAT